MSRKRTATNQPLAYKNEEYLDSDDARPIRILSEYLEPYSRLQRHRVHDTIVFFGSARIRERGALGRYYSDARRLAHLITTWSLSLPTKGHCFVVCTGGGPGIMEAANRGAHEAGGKTIGLNIHLPFEQVPNAYITPNLNFEFHYFFMRKLWFAYLAKALVVFPGGFGTFDELFELLTLSQTDKMAKRMCIVVYGKEYWDRVVNFQALVDAGTISPKDLQLFHWASTPEQAFELLKTELTKYQLAPPTSRDKGPDIAKTRP